MPDELNGLPVHVLLVHAGVVLVPLSSALPVLAAALPRVRARLGDALPLFAAVCLVRTGESGARAVWSGVAGPS